MHLSMNLSFLLVASVAYARAQSNACMNPTHSALHTHYHADSECNRLAYHDYKQSLNRNKRYNELKVTGNNQVPNQKTVFCPTEVQDIHQKNGKTGFDTVWLVENTSKSPVVLAFLDEGVERAALNPKVTPPQADPKSILMPGEYKAVHTFEGHVFFARQLLPDGGAGPVVLQHRVGLIPVGKAGDIENADCNLADPEPIAEETAEVEEEFARTPPVPMRRCNQIDLGFRNNVGCPLNGFWVRPQEDECEEKFKLHLGVNPMTNDFMHSWDSPTKFEASFVGHTFVFRRADTGKEVDRVTLAPTQVTDCPNLKQTNAIAVDSSGVIVPILSGVHRNSTSAVNATSTGEENSVFAHADASSMSL